MVTSLGRVAEFDSGLRWRVLFPEGEHAAASSYLRELAASDCSPTTLRSYAYDLLRWFRFIHDRLISWERAERGDVRDFIEFLRESPVPQRAHKAIRSRGLVNAATGKAELGPHYASRTINHQLSVLYSFYDHACSAPAGPLVNPVPAQRSRSGGRAHAHHNPATELAPARRASYRQKVPRPAWRGLPDDPVERLFDSLGSHRDRALLSFWLTSGVRASELLGLRHSDIDIGERTITVVSKGSRIREAVPASIDSFVWLTLYLAEAPPAEPAGPVWWTLRGTPRPLTYHAARAMLQRANRRLGTNWALHDLRHTAASSLLADPDSSLVEVQAILRHALSTTLESGPLGDGRKWTPLRCG